MPLIKLEVFDMHEFLSWVRFVLKFFSPLVMLCSALVSAEYKTAKKIPGKIEAEDYVGFVDSTQGNNGGVYRLDGVGIERISDNSDGLAVVWTDRNEILEYAINVERSGPYVARFRVSSARGNGVFTVELDGQLHGSAVVVGSAGGRRSWETIRMDIGWLSKGIKTLRIKVQGGKFNLDWIKLNREKNDVDNISVALALGPLPYKSFNNGVFTQYVWSLDDIEYYTWDNISQDNATRWLRWYRDCADLYEFVLDRPIGKMNTYSGRKHILAVVGDTPMLCSTVSATGCGSGGGKTQSWRNTAMSSANNPRSVLPHWIFFYKLGRGGGVAESISNKAIWPSNRWRAARPHTMAGLCMYQLQGDAVLEDTGATPGRLLAKLKEWERSTELYHEKFINGSAGEFSPQGLVAAMLMRIFQETGKPATIKKIFKRISRKPIRDNAKAAMCDFVDAVNSATGDQFNARLRGEWGMPKDC